MTHAPAAPAADASAPSITVMVVEDDAAMRDEFVAMIAAAPGLRLRGAAGSLAQARAHLAAAPVPDVLIVDLGLPDGDGSELIAERPRRTPAPNLLVSTVFGDEWHVIRGLEAGAHGYLLKDTSIDEFRRAIALVHAGGSPLSPQIARHLLKRFAAPPPPASLPAAAAPGALERLSARETEILTLIARGHSVAEVAQQLFLSPHTVTTHVKNIYAKLAVSNRVQAVKRARATGQIE